MTYDRINNNAHGLNSVLMTSPFRVGDTDGTTYNGKDWLVCWRDKTTLVIAPIHQPEDERPAHIYERDDTPEGLLFTLVPSGEQRLAKAIGALGTAWFQIDIHFRGERMFNAEVGKLLDDAMGRIEEARTQLELARKREHATPSKLIKQTEGVS